MINTTHYIQQSVGNVITYYQQFFLGGGGSLTFGTLFAHPFIIDNIVTPPYVAACIANARRSCIVLSSQSQRA